MADNDFITRAELRQELAEFGDRLETRLTARFEGRMDSLEERLNDRFDRRLDEKLRDLETHLLNAFYGFAETTNRKMVGLEAADFTMSSRISTLETRVLEIEKRLNLPPAA